VASATAGLMLALRALTGHRDGARLVPLPSFTFVATVNAVLWCGLEPVFVDVEPSSWHLDPAALSRMIAQHPGEIAAVLACSAFGTPPRSPTRRAWEEVCRAHGIPLLVDSAAGFGAEADDGQVLGLQGDAEVFSFHATKPLAAGEGGVVVTANEELGSRVARLSNFGFGEEREIETNGGLNAKMSELHAATALAALDRYPSVLAARRVRAARLREPLEGLGYRFQDGCEAATWQFVPVLSPQPHDRSTILRLAAETGVEVRRYYEPLHLAGAFHDVTCFEGLPVTEDLGSRIVSLPMHNRLSKADLERVVALAASSTVASRQSHA
jgi:dTDP-4-amino-4,6-dideoxygalactose transaminase